MGVVRPTQHNERESAAQIACAAPYGAVSRVLFGPKAGRSSLWDGGRPPPLAAYPRLTVAGVVGPGRTSPPIWPCSDWGLPCRDRYRPRGGLLPHRFTLTRLRGRSVFCGPVRRLSAPRRYLAVCPVELGLSSRPEGPATVDSAMEIYDGAGDTAREKARKGSAPQLFAPCAAVCAASFREECVMAR